MLQERPWLAQARSLGPSVTVWHGTNSHAWALACARGQIAPRDDWQDFASEVEREFSLPPGSVWRHPHSSFTRHSRASDSHVYCSADPQIARSYANDGSEAMRDTLLAVWRLLHPRSNPYSPTGKAAFRHFYSDWMAKHGIAPLVLELQVPVARLPVPQGSQIQDPAEWWAAANWFGPLPSVVFDHPLPLDWVVNPEPPAAAVSI